jgi:hypothetical protein
MQQTFKENNMKTMKKLNADQNLRDAILGITKSDYESMGDIAPFKGIKLSQLDDLFGNNFVDSHEKQNLAPSVGDIYSFVKQNPDFTVHGYAVDLSRSDYRISIEGVELSRNCTEEEWASFKRFFKRADELKGSVGTQLYCWFD